VAHQNRVTGALTHTSIRVSNPVACSVEVLMHPEPGGDRRHVKVMFTAKRNGDASVIVRRSRRAILTACDPAPMQGAVRGRGYLWS
jgi:hypothetical protein